MIDTKAIRERADKATPGPWTDGYYFGGAGEVFSLDARGERKVHVADCFTGPWNKDSAFIAHAREDVPALCDALDAARARAERLAAYVRAAQDLRRAEIVFGNEEPGTEGALAASFSVMDADCRVIAARGEFQPGDLGDGQEAGR